MEAQNPELYALVGSIVTALLGALVRMYELHKIHKKTKKSIDEAYESGKNLGREQYIKSAYRKNK